MLRLNGHSLPLDLYHSALHRWGRIHYRPFPWRERKQPYEILMAEIMLHRTRAAQVARIYSSFINRFPDVTSLHQAGEDQLRLHLYSLGLLWRVPLVSQMAERLVREHGAQVPSQKEALLVLPGVSDYIAAAVRCFVWGHPDALIDTNTVRVAGRMFGLKLTDSSRRSPVYRELLSDMVHVQNPAVYHYALLDLGAQVCTKATIPACNLCPVREWCLYGRSELKDLPAAGR